MLVQRKLALKNVGPVHEKWASSNRKGTLWESYAATKCTQLAGVTAVSLHAIVVLKKGSAFSR